MLTQVRNYIFQHKELHHFLYIIRFYPPRFSKLMYITYKLCEIEAFFLYKIMLYNIKVLPLHQFSW